MSRILISILVIIVGFLAGMSEVTAGFAGATVSLKGLNTTALEGVPVVIEISVQNQTGNELKVVDLADPDLAVLRWVWSAAPNHQYKVELGDYFLSSVPEPAFPKLLTLNPRGSISFRHTIPTPIDFPVSVEWTLAVSIYDPTDQSITAAETTFRGLALENAAGLPADKRRLMQAALLERSRTDVLDNKLDQKTLDKLAGSLGESHVLIKLLRYSKALHKDGDLEQRWQRLDRVSTDIEVLRNYLLYGEIAERSRSRTPALPTAIKGIAESIPEGQPFVDVIRRQVGAKPRSR